MVGYRGGAAQKLVRRWEAACALETQVLNRVPQKSLTIGLWSFLLSLRATCGTGFLACVRAATLAVVAAKLCLVRDYKCCRHCGHQLQGMMESSNTTLQTLVQQQHACQTKCICARQRGRAKVFKIGRFLAACFVSLTKRRDMHSNDSIGQSGCSGQGRRPSLVWVALRECEW